MQTRTKISTSIVIILAAISFLNQPSPSRGDDAPKLAPTTAPIKVKWEDAAKHVGETVTITGPVKGTHMTNDQKSLVLNVGKDYPDPARFTIMIAVDEKHPAKEEDYKDKTVTVTGKVEMYKKVPEIRVAKAADVTVGK